MNKEEKKQAVSELQDKFVKSTGVIITGYKGLTVEEISNLRTKLRDNSLEYKVVKNTLAQRASEGTSVEALKDLFSDPVGVAIGYEDSALLAKKVLEFAKTNDKLKIKGGVIEGKPCENQELKAISELPSRKVLLSMFAGMLQAPLSKMASALNATMTQFIYALEALKNKRES